jgi:hypothetical protein
MSARVDGNKPPCEDCGADRIWHSHEAARAAGWFSRRHKTDHALETSRDEKGE